MKYKTYSKSTFPIIEVNGISKLYLPVGFVRDQDLIEPQLKEMNLRSGKKFYPETWFILNQEEIDAICNHLNSMDLDEIHFLESEEPAMEIFGDWRRYVFIYGEKRLFTRKSREYDPKWVGLSRSLPCEYDIESDSLHLERFAD